jgi:hypothetical protein
LPFLVAGCALRSVQRPATREPTVQEARPTPVVAPAPARPSHLYAADEALRDVLSSELQYVGTGRWPGIERSKACAFRNARVLAVHVYCTLIETNAFRIEVFSPERGRVRLYAEASGPLSGRDRNGYFTFMAESGPPPGPETRLRPLTLAMSYQELRAYEQSRYDAYLPGCFAGVQNRRSQVGCLGPLAPQKEQWAARNRPFLERPNADWYRVLRQLRSLAALYGANPDG